MTTNEALLKEYVSLIEPHLDLAKKAYGSRSTDSPQHAASREYTRLLCEYYAKGGSLLDMAKALDVTYAGLRRRVTTKDLTPSSKRPRKRFPEEVYDAAVLEIKVAKETSTEAYHESLHKFYNEGLSLAKIATKLGLSSANPLYYGVSRVELKRDADSTQA